MFMNLTNVAQSLILNAQSYTVKRTTGSFTRGRWAADTPTEIEMFGVVTVVNEKELQQIPEADRITGAMYFFSKDPIYVTREGAVSDKIYWQGDWYRIFQIAQWPDYGYYRATGVRTTGN